MKAAAQLWLLCLTGCLAAATAQQEHPMMAMMRMMDSLDLPNSPMQMVDTSSPLSSGFLQGMPADSGKRLVRISIPMGSGMPLGSILKNAIDCACEDAAHRAQDRQSAMAAATAPTMFPMDGASLLSPRHTSGLFAGMPASSGGKSMSMRMVRDGSGQIRKTTTTIDAEGNEETRTETMPPQGSDGTSIDIGDMLSQVLSGQGSPFADFDEDEIKEVMPREEVTGDVAAGDDEAEDEDEDEDATSGMEDEEDQDKGHADAAEEEAEQDEENFDAVQDEHEQDEESPIEVSGKGFDGLDSDSKDAVMSAISSKLNLNPEELQVLSKAVSSKADTSSDPVADLQAEVVANAKADAAVKAEEAETLDNVRVAEGKASVEADAAKDAVSKAENELTDKKKAVERLAQMQRELEKSQAQSVVA